MKKSKGIGFCLLCAKPDEAGRWLRMAEQAGRGGDVIHFRPGGPYRFNFIQYELQAQGGSIDSVGQLMETLVEVSGRNQNKGDEQFWKLAGSRHLRNGVAAPHLAYRRVSPDNLYDFITSAPQGAESLQSEAWRQGYCAQTLAQLKALAATPEMENNRDLALAAQYWAREFPNLSEKTASVISTMCINVVSRFVSGPLAELVCADESNATPDDVLAGRIVIVDCPVLQYQEAGQFLQIMWKVATQRAALRQDPSQPRNPVVIWADEAQFFAVPGVDAMVQSVARQAKLITVAITQSIPTIVTALGGQDAETEAMAWIGNFQTRITCANSCSRTNQFFSEACGEVREAMMNTHGPQQDYDLVDDWRGQWKGAAGGMSEQYRPAVPPEKWQRLKKGGPANDFVMEAYVMQGGRVFSNGKVWIKGTFRQSI